MGKKLTPSPEGPNDDQDAANNQKGGGPKTEAGKKASSQNALKYGFFSPKALLPGESWEEYVSFHDAMTTQLCPRNALEYHVADKYIAGQFRLRRLPEIEAGIFQRYGISVQGHQCGSAFALVNSVQTDNILNQLARYEATLHRYSLKYLELLRTLRKDGWGENVANIVDAQVVDAPPAPPPAGDTAADPKPAAS